MNTGLATRKPLRFIEYTGENAEEVLAFVDSTITNGMRNYGFITITNNQLKFGFYIENFNAGYDFCTKEEFEERYNIQSPELEKYSMAPEEIFRVRWKVIAADTAGRFIVGKTYTNEDLKTWLFGKKPEQFPHIFRPMNWWEERCPEQMPMLVEKIKEGGYHTKGDILKVTRWIYNDNGWIAVIGDKTHCYGAGDLIPAIKKGEIK